MHPWFAGTCQKYRTKIVEGVQRDVSIVSLTAENETGTDCRERECYGEPGRTDGSRGGEIRRKGCRKCWRYGRIILSDASH